MKIDKELENSLVVNAAFIMFVLIIVAIPVYLIALVYVAFVLL